MSRCMVCDDKPEFAPKDLLTHMEVAHGFVDLTEPLEGKRSARNRAIALGTGVVLILLAGALAALYVGALVHIFNLAA